MSKLDMDRFNEIIKEYSSNFENSPTNTQQLVQFCKHRSYNFKYGALNPYFAIWKRQQTAATATKGGISDDSRSTPSDEEEEINWSSFWDQYETAYKSPPRNAKQFWSFVREEKFVVVKYKAARIAFDRILAEKSVKPIEGVTDGGNLSSSSLLMETSTIQNNDHDEIERNKKSELTLKITKYTPEDEIAEIKIKFLELLESFRLSILHDPVSPLQLFNFINEDTKYKVRYGDVKKCYNYSIKHKWFKPMKRTKKSVKKRNDDEGVEFILQIDHDKIENEKRREEEEKKEIIVQGYMNDSQYDDILVLYAKKYNNPPRNASQIMHFAKEEMNQTFKYKACRIAFNRWKQARGSKMPSPPKQEKEEVVAEPGANDDTDEDDDDDDDDEEEEENEE